MANIELRLSTGSATNKSVSNIRDSIGGKIWYNISYNNRELIQIK